MLQSGPFRWGIALCEVCILEPNDYFAMCIHTLHSFHLHRFRFHVLTFEQPPYPFCTTALCSGKSVALYTPNRASHMYIHVRLRALYIIVHVPRLQHVLYLPPQRQHCKTQLSTAAQLTCIGSVPYSTVPAIRTWDSTMACGQGRTSSLYITTLAGSGGGATGASCLPRM
jgi:hypothetical protein